LASYLFGVLTTLSSGLRKDLAEVIVGLGSKVLRFPGGNNIEGTSIDSRWKWNETIGPIKDRPGRPGNWGYYNTQGLGLLEYLQFCEDGGIEPVLAVYAGFSLDVYGQDGASFPEDKMELVLDDILNELEYVTGDTSTPYGALRASHGHPEPFALNYVEVGNEDWFSDTYWYRFPYLRAGIKATYPNITIVSTAFNENSDYNITLAPGDMWDTVSQANGSTSLNIPKLTCHVQHHYEEASFFVEGFDFYDNWQERTNNPGVEIFIGEYSHFQLDTPSGEVNYSRPEGIHIFYPTLESAISEGIYLLGAERNPNVVKMSAYAPSLANKNFEQWTPNLVTFQADYDLTVLSASYYMEQLFASYRGVQTLPTTTVSGDFNPLWWVATVEEGDSTVYFKVINSGNSSISLTLDFDRAWVSVNGTTMVMLSSQCSIRCRITNHRYRHLRSSATSTISGTQQQSLRPRSLHYPAVVA
jgi:alpha-L-arabinofuranosidase